MRILKLVLFLVLLPYTATAQLYEGKKGSHTYFVELTADSVHVIQFQIYYPYRFSIQEIEETVSRNQNSDTISINEKTFLLRKKDLNFLISKTLRKKETKIKLKICQLDRRDELRKEAYATLKTSELNHLRDSLANPFNFGKLDIDLSIRQIKTDSVSFDAFKKQLDVKAEALRDLILQTRSPISDRYYAVMHSFQQTDSAEIVQLLDSANFKYTYSKDFLYALSQENPDNLIHYVDQDPVNKKTLLKSIRNHKEYRKITSSIKTVPLHSKGKKEILKQRRKRTATDIAIGAGSATIVLAEIALLTGLLIWIF